MTDLRQAEAEFRALARGNGKPDDVRTLPPPAAPMKVARVLARECYELEDGGHTLRHWLVGVATESLGRGRAASGPRSGLRVHRARALRKGRRHGGVVAEPQQDC